MPEVEACTNECHVILVIVILRSELAYGVCAILIGNIGKQDGISHLEIISRLH